MKLDHKTRDRIDDYCRTGDRLADAKKWAEAIIYYEKARDLLPEPRQQWDAETWIACAIGDAWFLQANFEKSKACFQDACRAPRGDENTFVQLRMGQCCLKTGELDRAKKYLLNAFELGGEEIFDDEGPEYFAAIAGDV